MASVPIVNECKTAATSPTTTIQTVLSMATLVLAGSVVSQKARQSIPICDANLITLLCIATRPRHTAS